VAYPVALWAARAAGDGPPRLSLRRALQACISSIACSFLWFYRRRHYSPESSARLATIRIRAARDTPRGLAAASTRFKKLGRKADNRGNSFVFPAGPELPRAMKLSTQTDGSAASLR
jgi:hypothetical protein